MKFVVIYLYWFLAFVDFLVLIVLVENVNGEYFCIDFMRVIFEGVERVIMWKEIIYFVILLYFFFIVLNRIWVLNFFLIGRVELVLFLMIFYNINFM